MTATTWSPHARAASVLASSQTAVPSAAPVAAFDWDSTIVTPISPHLKFSPNVDHWRWFNDNVPTKLRALHEQGYQIVVFSNQAGIRDSMARAKNVTSRIDHFIAQLGIPIVALLACQRDGYRKPSPGMWGLACPNADISRSFFVGDAAGRPGDHSSDDILFAQAVGVQFHTPEDIFLAAPEHSVLLIKAAAVRAALSCTLPPPLTGAIELADAVVALARLPPSYELWQAACRLSSMDGVLGSEQLAIDIATALYEK